MANKNPIDLSSSSNKRWFLMTPCNLFDAVIRIEIGLPRHAAPNPATPPLSKLFKFKLIKI